MNTDIALLNPNLMWQEIVFVNNVTATNNINPPLVLLTCYCFTFSHSLPWKINLSYIQMIKRLKNQTSGLTCFSPLTSGCTVCYITATGFLYSIPQGFLIDFPALIGIRAFPQAHKHENKKVLFEHFKSIMRRWWQNFRHKRKPAKYSLGGFQGQ